MSVKPFLLFSAAVLSTAPAIANDEIVVTASRSGEGIALHQLGASVTVLDDEALSSRQTRLVSDVLRDVPGVSVNRSGAVGGLTQVRIRGSESNHVLVLIDGIEASDPYNGEYDFASLLAEPAARIEVLRGQQSSLYGSDAIGGVIHYMTLTGKEAPGITMRIEGGSADTFNGAARFAGVAGALDYVVSGTYNRTNGYPTARGGSRDVGSEIFGVNAKLIWSPSEAFRVTAVGRYSEADADTNDSEYDPTSPLFGHTIDSPGVRYASQSFSGLLKGEYLALEGRWTNAVSAQFTSTRRKDFADWGLNYGSDGLRAKGSFESSLRFGTEAVAHKLTGAVDVEREEYRNLTPTAFDGTRRSDNLGLVGQYELLVGEAFSAGASIRHDENNRFDDPTTWRVQGSYAITPGTRVRAAYGTGVKNPGYFELFGYFDGKYIGNPGLRPEKSEGYEVGLEQSFGSQSWATIGATYFKAKLIDEIYTSYPAPTYVATPDNRDTKSRQEGVELFLTARPLDQLRFDLAYTYLNAKEDGVTEVRRPRHIASLNTSLQSRDERFAGTLTIRYNGRQTDVAYTDPSYIPVRVELPEYVLVNLNGEFRISDGISIFGRIENLLDEDYDEVFSIAAQGRTAYAGIRASF